MIPLRDRNPSGTVPVVTVLIIIANIAVFLKEMSLAGTPEFDVFIQNNALIPAVTARMFAQRSASLWTIMRPFFTSMFLHGGVLHLIGNMWYLWLFGDNVEDRLGHMRFLLFYLACGVLGGMAHVAAGSGITMPTIGASGAVAGVLGAYFLCFPRTRVLTLVPIFVFMTFVELPAFILLFFWFALQLLSGVGSIGAAQPGVAWWAHIGGFAAGALLIFILPRHRGAKQRKYVVWHD